MDGRPANQEIILDPATEKSKGEIPQPIPNAPHLRINDAISRRKSSMGIESNGTFKHDDHIENIRTMDTEQRSAGRQGA